MGAVGDAYCRLVTGCRENRNHRSERLFPGHGGLLGDAIDHRELVIEIGRVSTRPAATDQDLGTAVYGIFDVPIHFGGGGLVVQRTHGRVVGEGIAQPHKPGRLQGCLDEGIVKLVDHDHPLGGGADLPGVVIGAIDRGGGGSLDVRVGSHYQRSIARHFHDCPLEAHRRDNPLAGLG